LLRGAGLAPTLAAGVFDLAGMALGLVVAADGTCVGR
jgi:hypothetical protein